ILESKRSDGTSGRGQDWQTRLKIWGFIDRRVQFVFGRRHLLDTQFPHSCLATERPCELASRQRLGPCFEPIRKTRRPVFEDPDEPCSIYFDLEQQEKAVRPLFQIRAEQKWNRPGKWKANERRPKVLAADASFDSDRLAQPSTAGVLRRSFERGFH